mmetsp:Transcript_27095/g.45473  ORF Transcript_27095/g.45473 Transcript_27095/m.45473 type:complete len:169 (-) Transcript_27095:114-620(-)|eukprot:CAMPEP_0184342948 /NCGR_PEP_ID=MMETSP1089-20130417/11512_1 /TAXON_ID=38269 ORGANISM="Gloeochaete wittrockiana, Strain SAG46.84" /NCGR_SAMPLE_ID=MMETSP1089 /ASSEMBLY_ACC=CAM_ASM_000445 /LENGTH=168 /DNA_ID=CAMNT_0026672043 /DNA_START=95 /DNA_END=601 /DNA_ORIENTATION=-
MKTSRRSPFSCLALVFLSSFLLFSLVNFVEATSVLSADNHMPQSHLQKDKQQQHKQQEQQQQLYQQQRTVLSLGEKEVGTIEPISFSSLCNNVTACQHTRTGNILLSPLFQCLINCSDDRSEPLSLPIHHAGLSQSSLLLMISFEYGFIAVIFFLSSVLFLVEPILSE